jgi:membrane fusion protein (multidrug efflux system)
MRNTAFLLVIVILAALAGAAGWYWWTEWRFVESTDDAYVQADTGIISPKIDGYVRQVRVRDNQSVAAGDVMFVIEDRDFAAKTAQAEAVVATAEATVATYANRLDFQQAIIGQAETSVTSADIDLERARLDQRRYAALTSSDFASRQRFESADADARKAQAALDKTRAALTAERNQLAVLRSQKAEEEARLAQARASVALARSDLDNTVIRAPFAGVVGNRAARVGQYVKPGTQLAALVPLPQVYITANFKETQLTHMRPGQPAEIVVDAFPEERVTGTIESFAPASGAQFSLLPPDNATGNFTKIVQRVPVRIALPAEAPLVQRLRPGLSATVSIDTRREAHAGSAAVASDISVNGR